MVAHSMTSCKTGDPGYLPVSGVYGQCVAALNGSPRLPFTLCAILLFVVYGSTVTGFVNCDQLWFSCSILITASEYRWDLVNWLFHATTIYDF
jgi:hypothetical protein